MKKVATFLAYNLFNPLKSYIQLSGMWTIIFIDNYGKITIFVKVLLQIKDHQQVKDTDHETAPR